MIKLLRSSWRYLYGALHGARLGDDSAQSRKLGDDVVEEKEKDDALRNQLTFQSWQHSISSFQRDLQL